jgi:hypothetical protein
MGKQTTHPIAVLMIFARAGVGPGVVGAPCDRHVRVRVAILKLGVGGATRDAGLARCAAAPGGSALPLCPWRTAGAPSPRTRIREGASILGMARAE